MNRGIFTVIIQNEKTSESFLEHQSLFVDAINDGRVAVCKWNEKGTTIDTALPELPNIINDTHLWRAIIVRYIDDDCMAACNSDPVNPFDFVCDSEKYDVTSVPLIRLTQMLGGVPLPSPRFQLKDSPDDETDSVKHDTYERRKKKIYYDVSYDEKTIAERKEREKRYGMDGRPPISILIVSVRRDYNRDVFLFEHSFTGRSEADSSRFWETNEYPCICRFLVCDFINEGLLQREADEFNLWFSVMILSTNVYNSDIISAYKLYRLKTIWDKELMTDSFQRTVNRLKDAYKIIKDDLNKDFVYRSDISDTLPDFVVDVPVVIKQSSITENHADSKDFGLLADDRNVAFGDVKSWDKKSEIIEQSYQKSIKNAERSLDKSSESVRAKSYVDEQQAKVFGRYQEEDMENEIDKLFSTIVKQQSQLPDGNFVNEKEYYTKKNAVREYLFRRVQRNSASSLVAFAFVLAILTVGFSLFFKSLEGYSDALVLLLLILSFCLVAFISVLVVLLAQKFTLNGLIKSFNKVVVGAFDNIVSSIEKYKAFVSNIASHSKGSSFLAWSLKKEESICDIHEMRHAHLKAINNMIKKLESWTKAYHLDVDFDAERISQHVDVNVTIAPIENKMYAFEADKKYPIEVNNSGVMLQSPYNFACKIEICREELYGNK